MTWPCPDPAFTWDSDQRHWGPCTTCHRYAWEHEQADPLADMYNTVRMWREGTDASHYPPTMKPHSECPDDAYPRLRPGRHRAPGGL